MQESVPYPRACSGYCLAEQWHKAPILVEVLDGNAQNVCLCMLMCIFPPWFCRCLCYPEVLLDEILLLVMLSQICCEGSVVLMAVICWLLLYINLFFF